MTDDFFPGRVFDNRQVRRSFGRAAEGYDAASHLQREIESRLLESLDYYALRHGDATPGVILDVACGPARAATPSSCAPRWPTAPTGASPTVSAARP